MKHTLAAGCGALLLTVLCAAQALAHPVAQGALAIDVRADQVTLRARVALEEAIVANAFGPAAARAETPVALRRSHADYLIAHLRVYADGQRLNGRVTGPAEAGPLARAAGAAGPPGATSSDRVVYEFAYDQPAHSPRARYPGQIRIEQDVLNEFEFAPGNRWEATYVVTIAERGRPRVAGLLLTSREPLLYQTQTAPARQTAGAQQPAATQNAAAAADLIAAAAPQIDRWRLCIDYLRHGVIHILTGYDHLLFICALVLATVTLWDLIKIVTAFTLAHTMTLTLAVLDIVRLSSHIVEPMIASSIVVVALDNVLRPQRSRGRGRLLIAFFFGLFHGLGFAGGLLDAMDGMAGLTVGLAIVAFSAGVELGHQIVVLPLFGALRLADRVHPGSARSMSAQAVAMRYGSMLIAAAGGVYLVAALR